MRLLRQVLPYTDAAAAHLAVTLSVSLYGGCERAQLPIVDVAKPAA